MSAALRGVVAFPGLHLNLPMLASTRKCLLSLVGSPVVSGSISSMVRSKVSQ
jgi:hypothetical protein